MPVLFEGDSFPSSTTSPSSKPHHRHPQLHPYSRKHGLLDDDIPEPLAWLCVFLALFALLSLILQIRASSARRKAASTYPIEKHQAFIAQAWEEPQQLQPQDSLAASYYDENDDLGMDPSPTSTSSTTTASAATIQDSDKWAQQDWQPMPSTQLASQMQAQAKDLDTGMGDGNGMNTGSMETTPPRRRSYTKMKTMEGQDDIVQLNVQGEIVVAEGWRRHTRVYGGGVCLACAESERRMKGMGA